MEISELRKIEELVTIYELEDTLFDVFTEGEYDKGVVRQFLASTTSAQSRIAIYAIDEINVSGDLVRSFGMQPGNRSEVVSLCMWLGQKMGSNFDRAIGIVDADFDHILGLPIVSPLLLRTDFSCAEMYFFNEVVFEKLFHIAFSKAKIAPRRIIQILTPVLNRLFLIRLVDETLKLSCEWPALNTFVKVKGGDLLFDEEGFLRQYLGSRGRMKDFPMVQDELKIWTLRLPADGRFAINGHDLIECLSIYLASFYGKAVDKERLRPVSLSYVFTCCMENKGLRDAPMFLELMRRLSVEFAE